MVHDRNARELVEYAESFGFKVIRSKNHIVMERDDGLKVVIASTPSNRRGLLNKKAEIRRIVQGRNR